MGLDMYLKAMPRCSLEPDQIDSLAYLNTRMLRGDRNIEEELNELTPEEKDFVDRYFPSAAKTYAEWDEEKRFPYSSISEEVAYWRKANAIHRWFVDNVQDGEDDCKYHREVTKEDLMDLRGKCASILVCAILKDDKIKNGYTFANGREEPIYVDGKTVINPDICEEQLPTMNGFFFGSTDYDEYYIEDIKYTYEKLSKLLSEFDWENRRLFYVSSW